MKSGRPFKEQSQTYIKKALFRTHFICFLLCCVYHLDIS